MKNKCYELLKICEIDDISLFNDYLQNEIKINDELILEDNVLKEILISKNIYNSLFYKYRNDDHHYFYIHPLLYLILNYALLYPSIYEKQILKILDFGIKHNLKIANLISCDEILKNGNLIKNNVLVGRVLIYSTKESIDGNDKLFIKLNELQNSIRKIKTSELYLAGGYSGLSVKLKNDIIEKERTFNEHEYTFLKLMEDNSYLKVPRYLGVKNGKDLFSYINGNTIPYTYEMSESTIISITKELKKINTISKKHLNGKVYVHGDLGTQNVVFNKNNEIVGIIDWDNTSIGEEYEDFIYIFWTWANVGNLNRDDERMFMLLKIMINIYKPNNYFKNNFANKIINLMEQRLKKTPVNLKTYKRIYEWVKWSEEWVQKYKDKITLEIG